MILQYGPASEPLHISVKLFKHMLDLFKHMLDFYLTFVFGKVEDEVFLKSFCKCQTPHIPVDVSSVITI